LLRCGGILALRLIHAAILPSPCRKRKLRLCEARERRAELY
jgi:hypothetical protein